jgi:hypothetical protein
VRVNGDILFDSNSGALSATRNQVGGNVQAFQNTGGVTLADNLIDGNLQCKENDPPPTGEGNLVKGNIEDQCEGLGVELSQRVFLAVVGLSIPAPDIGTPEAAPTRALLTEAVSEPGSTGACEAAVGGCASRGESAGPSLNKYEHPVFLRRTRLGLLAQRR